MPGPVLPAPDSGAWSSPAANAGSSAPPPAPTPDEGTIAVELPGWDLLPPDEFVQRHPRRP